MSTDKHDIGNEDRDYPSPPTLTPAASELVDQFASTLRDKVIEDSLREQGSNASLIRVDNIDAAIKRVMQAPARRTDLMFALALSGVVLTFTVIGTLIALATSPDSPVATLVPALGALCGTLFALASTVIIIRRKRAANPDRRSRRTRNEALDFLSEMLELERLANRVVNERFNSEQDSITLGSLLALLEDMNFWTKEDTRNFRNLLVLRNGLVHEDVRVDDIDELTEASRMTSVLIRKLKVELARMSAIARRLDAWRTYEERVHESLQRIDGVRSIESGPLAGDTQFDFAVDYGTGRVWVDVKYRPRGELSANEIARLTNEASSRTMSVLMITNASLSDAVRELNASNVGTLAAFEVIQWASEVDDGQLARAIGRLTARSSRQPTHSRVEIFRDRSGRYRFRLKARNGEILAVSESYIKKADVLSAVDEVRRNTSFAELHDVTGS